MQQVQTSLHYTYLPKCLCTTISEENGVSQNKMTKIKNFKEDKVTSDLCNVYRIPEWKNRTSHIQKPHVLGKRKKYLKNYKIEGIWQAQHKWTYNTIGQRDVTYPINVWNSHKGTALID